MPNRFPTTSQFRPRGTARQIPRAIVLATLVLAAHPATAETFTYTDIFFGEDVLLDFAPAEYGVYGETHEFKAGRQNIQTRDGTAEFVAAFEAAGAPAEVFVGAPGIPRFARPFNNAPNGFASARAAADGTLEVGASGNFGLPGTVDASAGYSYSITPRNAGGARLALTYTIPELDLKLQGSEEQEGRVPLRLGLGDTPELQHALVSSALIYTITDAVGNLVDSGTAYDYTARLAKHSVFPGLEDELGFDLSISDDLRDTILSNVTTETYTIEKDFFGPLDLATWTVGEINDFTIFPRVAPGNTLELTFLTRAFVLSPASVLEVAGGEARIGDPFAPLSGAPTFSWSLVADDPIPPPSAVPVPASILLLAGALGGLATLGRRRKHGTSAPLHGAT